MRIVIDNVEVEFREDKLIARYTPPNEKFTLEGQIAIPQAKAVRENIIPKAINFLDMVKLALQKIGEQPPGGD